LVGLGDARVNYLLIILGAVLGAAAAVFFILFWERRSSAVSTIEGKTQPELSQSGGDRFRSEALLGTIQQLGALLTGPAGMEQILDQVLELVAEVVDYDSSSIFLFDEKKGIHFAAARGFDRVNGLDVLIEDHSELFLPTRWSGERTLYYPDTRESPDWYEVPETSYIRSWIGAALFVKDTYIGLLTIDSSDVSAYTDEDIHLVRAFADQAAIAIDNAKLLDEKEKRSKELNILYELNKKLSSTLDSRQIIDSTLELVGEAFGGEKVDFYRYHEGSDHISLERSFGRLDSELEKINYQLSFGENKSDVGWVREHQTSLRISRVREHELWVELPRLDSDIQSLITVPVIIGQDLLAALSVLHSEEDAFSEDQQQLLEAVGQQVGLALNNAQRYVDVAHLLNSIEGRKELQDKLLEYLPIGILLLDHDFKVLSANQKGINYVEELQKSSIEGKIEDLGGKNISEIVRHAADPLPMVIKRDHSDNELFEVQLRNVNTSEGNYWILMVSDVTRERMAKKRMQVQERMATLGQFAAGIAHDFNNIMSAILVYSDVIVRDQSLSSKNISRIHVIREQSHRAAELITQILDFSRISNLEMKAFDLVPFLISTKSLLKRMMPENVNIILDINTGSAALRLYGDQSRIQQMIMNLAANAREAMPDGGDLVIGLETFALSAYAMAPFPKMVPGNWIHISVRDNGGGIAPEDQPKIFDPFFSTKRSEGGTGLGLSQVYGIVKQHQGYIDVESKIGRGTTFHVYFPLFEGAIPDGERGKTAVSLDGNGRVVLVVEDDFSLRNALWNMLEDYNFQVILADDGVKGLNIIQQIGERLSLVVTDVVMPNMGGAELFRKSRELHPALGFLFITGHPAKINEYQFGDDPYLTLLQKPFTLMDILREIEDIFKRLDNDKTLQD
jgi:signal transduction histidine kinase/ActR/RegA family two-component response regulator